MTIQVSRPIKLFVLVAVIAGFGGVAMLSLHKKAAVATPVVSRSTAPAAKTKASVHVNASTQASAKASAKAKPTQTAPKPVIASNGLPTTVEDALHGHRIVVVAVFDPQSATDAISYAEARAGAAEAGAGFVGVSLLDSTEAGALTSLLPGGGLLPSPGVLIYRRPGTLVQLLDGFNDRDVVAQAAATSETAAPLTATSGS
ncbi:MAG TPA: hypothetical protein VKR23_16185 [Gaiellaceae bacterium]|nr:hypothetical protein [Gaiellaceae bacterium]